MAGDEIELKGKDYEVVGVARAPLGGQAADIYLSLDWLQRMSDREGRVNTVQVRANSTDDVASAERHRAGARERVLTMVADLVERVGGSLTDAKELSDNLGIALTILALVAAFLIASPNAKGRRPHAGPDARRARRDLRPGRRTGRRRAATACSN